MLIIHKIEKNKKCSSLGWRVVCEPSESPVLVVNNCSRVIGSMSAPCPFFCLPVDLVGAVVVPFLGFADIVHLDTACCSDQSFDEWMLIARGAPPISLKRCYHQDMLTVLYWFQDRGLKAANVFFLSRGLARFMIDHPQVVRSIYCEITELVSERHITQWNESDECKALINGTLRCITSLDAEYEESMVDWVTRAISANPTLTHLTLAIGIQPNEVFFSALHAQAATLTDLEIKGRLFPFSINDCIPAMTARIAPSFPRLQKLAVDPSSLEDDFRVVSYWDPHVSGSIAAACSDLRSLALDKTGMCAKSLAVFLQRCPRLQKICLSDTTVGDAELLALSARCLDGAVDPYPVTHLTVSWTVTDTATLTRCSAFLGGLRRLCISPVEDADWTSLGLALRYMPALQSLRLSPFKDHYDFDGNSVNSDRSDGHPLPWREDIPATILQSIAIHCSGLRTLSVAGPVCEVCDTEVAQILSHCRQLEKLYLSDLKVPITDAAFTALTHSTVTACEGCSVTAAAAAAAAAAVATGASAGATTNPVGGGYAATGAASAADTATTVGTTAAAALALTTISFNAEHVTDDGVIALAKHCPALQSLSISNISKLTDMSVIALAAYCPQLRSVAISGTNPYDESKPTSVQVSARVLEVLCCACPQLTWVAVGRPALNAKAIARIRAKIRGPVTTGIGAAELG